MTNQYHIYCPKGKVLGGTKDIYAAERTAKELGEGHTVRTSSGRHVSSEEMKFLEEIRND